MSNFRERHVSKTIAKASISKETAQKLLAAA